MAEKVALRTKVLGVISQLWAGFMMNAVLQILISAVFRAVGVNPDGTFWISPTTVDSVWIVGLIFGAIMGVLATRGIVKAGKALILEAAHTEDTAAAPAPPQSKWLTRLPKNTALLTLTICALTMAFSYFALPLLMRLFGWRMLNYAQFIVFMTIYAYLMGKPIQHLLSGRLKQPDYIAYTLSHAAVKR
ncbi:MAG: hypothetical protein LBB58_03425 [Cellulomonadaceae bacterium]|jgi:hypothetical protein|nr:hypothetical protein [Cellulomonadaceae bacterium]